ncbi:hypothetical protein L6R50_20960 [Myxococcota bacterium]|nr:hypothetical protein [Myxococcota bacterium]
MRNLLGLLAGPATAAVILSVSGVAHAEVGDIQGILDSSDGEVTKARFDIEEYFADGSGRTTVQQVEAAVDEDGTFLLEGIDSEAPFLVVSAYTSDTGELLGRALTDSEITSDEVNPIVPVGELSTFQVDVLDAALTDARGDLALDDVQPVLLMTLIDEGTMQAAREFGGGMGLGVGHLGRGFRGANRAFVGVLGRGFGIHGRGLRHGLGLGFRGILGHGLGFGHLGFRRFGVGHIGFGALPWWGIGISPWLGIAPFGFGGMVGVPWCGVGGFGLGIGGLGLGLGAVGVPAVGVAGAFGAAAVSFTSVVSFTSYTSFTSVTSSTGAVGGLGFGLGGAAAASSFTSATSFTSSVSYSSFTSAGFGAAGFGAGFAGLGVGGGTWPWLVGVLRTDAVEADGEGRDEAHYLQDYAVENGLASAWPEIYATGERLSEQVGAGVELAFTGALDGSGETETLDVALLADGVADTYLGLIDETEIALEPVLAGAEDEQIEVISTVLGSAAGIRILDPQNDNAPWK